MSKFIRFGDFLREEAGSSGTTTADIASTDNVVDFIKRNTQADKGKKCKKHGVRNCEKCEDLRESSKWN